MATQRTLWRLDKMNAVSDFLEILLGNKIGVGQQAKEHKCDGELTDCDCERQANTLCTNFNFL